MIRGVIRDAREVRYWCYCGICCFRIKTDEKSSGDAVARGWFDLEFDVCDGAHSKTEKNKKAREFKESTNDIVIDKCSRRIFASESQCKMKWAVNMFCDWRKYRMNLQLPPVEIC